MVLSETLQNASFFNESGAADRNNPAVILRFNQRSFLSCLILKECERSRFLDSMTVLYIVVVKTCPSLLLERIPAGTEAFNKASEPAKRSENELK